MTRPDGIEVVDTLEGASLELPPLLVIDRITDYLDEVGLGSGPVEWQRIGDGQSNITYQIKRGRETFVLRRGPRPPLPQSAHDMVREARILTELDRHGMPVPKVLKVCDDESVLGVPFYIMDWLEGVVITNAVPVNLDGVNQRHETTRAMVRGLAQLHSLDITDPGIASLGRPEGYLSRQVARFAQLWESNCGRDLGQVADLAAWLGRNQPASPRSSIVHGDYRLGNMMFAPDAPARLLAVLDWEMATLGDPLSDLGYLVGTYTEDGAPRNPLHMSPVTVLPGYHRRAELVAEYADLTGFDVSSLDWYRVLALWKAAVFCEAIYARWMRGERPGDRFGPLLEAGVPALLTEASNLAT